VKDALQSYGLYDCIVAYHIHLFYPFDIVSF